MATTGYDPRDSTIDGVPILDIVGNVMQMPSPAATEAQRRAADKSRCGPSAVAVYSPECPRCGGRAERRSQPCNCPAQPPPPFRLLDAACVVVYWRRGEDCPTFVEGLPDAAAAAKMTAQLLANPHVVEVLGSFSLGFLRGKKGFS